MKLQNKTTLKVAIILSISFLTGAMLGCATNTPDANKNARNAAVNQTLREAGKILGKVGAQMLYDTVASEASGSKIDYQQSGAHALWANINYADSASAVGRISAAYSENKAPVTADAAEVAFAKAPSSNAVAKVHQIASVISAATGAPPKL